MKSGAETPPEPLKVEEQKVEEQPEDEEGRKRQRTTPEQEEETNSTRREPEPVDQPTEQKASNEATEYQINEPEQDESEEEESDGLTLEDVRRAFAKRRILAGVASQEDHERVKRKDEFEEIQVDSGAATSTELRPR